MELPIFEGKKIILEIILFRLPCTLSPFYKTENLTTNEINNNIINNKSNKNYNISTKKTTDMTNNYQNIYFYYQWDFSQEQNPLIFV